METAIKEKEEATIKGKNDKGKAVEILKELYENQFFSISTVGIGDSLNDLPMLFATDHPIFLKEKEKDSPLPEELSFNKNLTVINGTGPKAWNEVILGILKDLNP
jgi:predicted mannosyl-3-phosphoglycerate phosphatase (HAD superfamily)